MREDIYFTSTHTHSGPGGYSRPWVYQLVLGRFDENILNRLAGTIADVIRQSRSNMKPARLTVSEYVPESPQHQAARNRLTGGPGYNAMPVVAMLDEKGSVIACLLSFSAHPTVLRQDNRKISGDYPGYVQRQMEAKLNCVALFAAGAVGSMGVKSELPGPADRIRETGDKILDFAYVACGNRSVSLPTTGSSGSAPEVPADSNLASNGQRTLDPTGYRRLGPLRGEVQLASTLCGRGFAAPSVSDQREPPPVAHRRPLSSQSLHLHSRPADQRSGAVGHAGGLLRGLAEDLNNWSRDKGFAGGGTGRCPS